MDKHAVLKQFEKLAGKISLESGEIRLYLLLLANCRDTGDGEIEYGTIKDAFGDICSMRELQRVCRHMEEHGMIEILTPLDGIRVDNSILTYKISSFAGEKVR